TLETAAQLLWNWDRVPDLASKSGSDAGGMAGAYGAIAALAATDMPSAGRGKAVLIADAARVVGTLASVIAGTGNAPMHERLARQWARPEAADPLRRALVLLAEHELNASTFAARVTASTGAPLSAAVLAGL